MYKYIKYYIYCTISSLEQIMPKRVVCSLNSRSTTLNTSSKFQFDLALKCKYQETKINFAYTEHNYYMSVQKPRTSAQIGDTFTNTKALWTLANTSVSVCERVHKSNSKLEQSLFSNTIFKVVNNVHLLLYKLNYRHFEQGNCICNCEYV